MNISTRFLNDLFIRKKVRVGQKYYALLYHTIWPSEESFIEFLETQDSEVRIEKAKLIYEQLVARESLFLPQEYILNVVWLQQHYLAGESSAYIPKDHVIHCVNLYIMGIYIFFNNRRVFEKLLQKESLDHAYIFSAIKEFVVKWKMFAFYHDHGYLVEACIGESVTRSPVFDEKINVYNDLQNELLYSYIVRGTAKALFMSCLYARSNRKLENYMDNVPDKIFLRDGKEKLSKEDVLKLLENKAGYTCMNGIQTPCGLEYLSPFVKNEDLLLLFSNADDGLYGLYYEDNNGAHILSSSLQYTKKIEDFVVMGYYEKDDDEDKCIVFVKDFINSFQQTVLKKGAYYRQDLLRHYDLLPESILVKFKFIKDDLDLNDIYFDIYLWLTKIAPYARIKNNDMMGDAKYLPFKERAIIEAVCNIAKKRTGALLNDKTITETCEELGREVAEILEEAISEKATEYYGKEVGTTYSVVEIIRRAITNATLQPLKLFDLDETETLYKLNLFPINDSDIPEVAKRINKELRDCAKTLNIDFNQLIEYRPDHSPYDHGFVSAALIYRAIILRLLIGDGNVDSLASVGQREYPEGLCSNKKHDWAQLVFSIMIHNVYTNRSRPTFGLDYKHDWDDNPFSFFCSLADILQKWGRPRQIEQSRRGLPQNHYLDDSYDISIDNDTIVISCDENALSELKNELNDINDYLPGAKLLIRIIPDNTKISDRYT